MGRMPRPVALYPPDPEDPSSTVLVVAPTRCRMAPDTRERASQIIPALAVAQTPCLDADPTMAPEGERTRDQEEKHTRDLEGEDIRDLEEGRTLGLGVPHTLAREAEPTQGLAGPVIAVPADLALRVPAVEVTRDPGVAAADAQSCAVNRPVRPLRDTAL